jgi:protein-S-isoprenylcysteine O-methyltransferase Ste14
MDRWISEIGFLPWHAFFIIWVVTAFRVKQSKLAEPAAIFWLTRLCLIIAFGLIFLKGVPLGPLHQRFMPQTPLVEVAGAVLTYAGLAVAIWARLSLGANWSAEVDRKIGHELIRSGPYAYLRHPIYSGLLLAVVGTALEIGEWRGMIAAAVIAVVNSFKARREEQFMLAEFGNDYVRYRQSSGFLLPKF